MTAPSEWLPLLPEVLVKAARSPFDARLLLYRLVLADELTVRLKQRHLLGQEEGNAIIWIAHRVLNNLPLEPGFYGNVMVITEDQLNNSMLSNADVVICGRNATREKFNKYIRREIVGFTGQLPVHGERMICRKNNWQIDADGINLANGLI
jgi:hypothetical protein